jgi:hypothetical protein
MCADRADDFETPLNEPPEFKNLVNRGDFVKRHLDRLYEKLFSFSSEHFNLMMESREYTHSMLASTNPRTRWAALQILALRWSSYQEFAEVCERFLDDESEDIRVLAISRVSKSNFGSHDLNYIKKFIGIALDESLNLRLRRISYFGFLDVIGEPVASRPDIFKLFVELDVDYAKINNYLTSENET